ncbi:DNA polymerase III subunit gamma/tau [Enterovirga rhinocerotis]|uniref:DNA polymerase III subunit gamma/tau n=1 Tax=Enterovirga rhinocerotis TaxID=1339210 RepID=A0A4V3DZF2_9HYPH|nr:DNA polymerase III subunit gamma/tau [Enterovirga rhinocerotis]TDR95905.1 DNA polymerase-3 subunit gamma/tau [Enterovirga rhinocerotis]
MSDIRDGEPQTGGDEGQAALLGFEAPPSAQPAPTPYRVLARKYRPQTFADLIGQEAMVQTVRNAFAANRIPQAWMLTGVRGVGKTTTARILARALNYDTGEPGSGPSIDMPDLGIHCRAIMESRHVDVLEMDAASHTGVENIRQITDAVRYAPVQARYKVYVIDEVHMLSTAAFNAFLKTLEEPPPHAKFVFATTEIRKVPVTILSRCQRFDLRRVESATLIAHLDRICRAEAVEAEPEALAAIARAAEGSVRDSLSLLDQAVAHGAGAVTAIGVRDMLGLADRSQVIDLFEAAMRGDVPGAFAVLRAGWDAGADPRQMMEDLAAFTHLVTRIKLVPDAADDPSLTEAERLRGREFAGRLPVRALSRAWQILLKAVPEVGAAQRPLATAEMALVRLAYAADLPSPDEVLRSLRGEASAPPTNGGGGGGRAPSGGFSGSLAMARTEPAPMRMDAVPTTAPRLQAVPRTDAPPAAVPVPAPQTEAVVLRRFEDVVALAGENRDVMLKTALERDVRLVQFEDGRIEIALEPTARQTLPGELTTALQAWTNRRWVISLSKEASAPTIAEERTRRETERRQDATNHPLVQAVLSSFPGAKVVDVRERAPEPEAAEDEPQAVDRTGEAGADEDEET